jgi:hypothetical protein
MAAPNWRPTPVALVLREGSRAAGADSTRCLQALGSRKWYEPSWRCIDRGEWARHSKYVRQSVRRLERRGPIEPVGTHRQGSAGAPELVWKPSPDGGYVRGFAALRDIADSGEL